MKLKGRGILVTGGSQGFGLAITRACVAQGADVFICGRDEKVLLQASLELETLVSKGQKIFKQVADISQETDVKRLIDSVKRDLPNFNGVVNNAGIYGPKGLTDELNWQEWKRTIEINLLGSVSICRAVLPIFRKQSYGKIVSISGGGAAAALPRFSAYAASKAALVRFTETLAQELNGSGIDVNAVAPGALNTHFLDEVLAAGANKVGEDFYQKSLKQKETGGASLEKGSALCVFLLSSASDGITGRLLSALWDPWEKLPQKKTELANSDIYTLRRIVPEDRGLSWS